MFLHPSEPDRSGGCQYKTMKHNILISVSILAAFIGCTKIDVRAPEHIVSAVRFNAPVVSNITKATGEIDGEYPIDESFAVFSVYHADGFDGWGTGISYINRAKFTYDASLDDSDADTLGGWTGGYYFPKNGSLSFAAYSPYSAHKDSPDAGTGTFEYASGGLTITNFTVPALADQYDLMYSERIYNKTGNDGVGDGYEGLDLVFQHALSAIHFQVQQKAEYTGYTIKLKSISLNDIRYKGSFSENITNENPTSFVSAPKWVPVSDQYADYNIYSGDLKLTQIGGSNYHTGFPGAILLPQSFTSSDTAYITIDYSITPPSMPGSEISQTATVPLYKLSNTWEMGKRYTYNISIGYDAITISPTVLGWTDVPGDITVN